MKPEKEEKQPPHSQQQQQDAQCWQGVRMGHAGAMMELYERHYDGLYNYALKICRNADTASDCVQEMFLRIWESRHSLTDVRQPKPYLFRVLRNVTIDWLRKNTRLLLQDEIGSDALLFELSPQDFLIEAEQDAEKLGALTKAIEHLSPRQKEIIYMRYYNELDYQAIAEITQTNYQSVRNLMHRALESLKKNLP